MGDTESSNYSAQLAAAAEEWYRTTCQARLDPGWPTGGMMRARAHLDTAIRQTTRHRGSRAAVETVAEALAALGNRPATRFVEGLAEPSSDLWLHLAPLLADWDWVSSPDTQRGDCLGVGYVDEPWSRAYIDRVLVESRPDQPRPGVAVASPSADENTTAALDVAVRTAVAWVQNQPGLPALGDLEGWQTRINLGGYRLPFPDEHSAFSYERHIQRQGVSGGSLALPVAIATVASFLPEWVRRSARRCVATGRLDHRGNIGVVDHFEAKADATAEIGLPLLSPDRQPAPQSTGQLWPMATLGDAIPLALPLAPLLSASEGWAVGDPARREGQRNATPADARLLEVRGESTGAVAAELDSIYHRGLVGGYKSPLIPFRIRVGESSFRAELSRFEPDLTEYVSSQLWRGRLTTTEVLARAEDPGWIVLFEGLEDLDDGERSRFESLLRSAADRMTGRDKPSRLVVGVDRSRSDWHLDGWATTGATGGPGEVAPRRSVADGDAVSAAPSSRKWWRWVVAAAAVVAALAIPLSQLGGSDVDGGSPTEAVAVSPNPTMAHSQPTTMPSEATTTPAAMSASTTTISATTTVPAAAAESGGETAPGSLPALHAIQLPEGESEPGTDVPISVTVTGATEVAAVFFERPSGVSATLPMSQFTRDGDVFTASIEIPASAATGMWLVSSVVVYGNDGAQYHILNPDSHPSEWDCVEEGFRYAGAYMCAEQSLAGVAELAVGGDNMALAPPTLESIVADPATVAPGDTFELRVNAPGADEIQTVFFAHETSGESVLFEARPIGVINNLLVARVTVPEFVRDGNYIIGELIVQDSIDEIYGFMHPYQSSGVPQCPDVEDLGARLNCRANVLLDVFITVTG